MDVANLDLAELAQTLSERVPTGEPKGYLRGKSILRGVVRAALACSDLEAEDLVETLELRGYLRFEGDPAQRSQVYSRWVIDPGAEL